MADSITTTKLKQLTGVRWNASTKRFEVRLQRGCYHLVYIGSFHNIKEVERAIALALEMDDRLHMPTYPTTPEQAVQAYRPPSHSSLADIIAAELAYLDEKGLVRAQRKRQEDDV